MAEEEISASAEDYLEALYLLIKDKDEIGTSDIASFLGVKLPSVTEMMGKLKKKGLVNHEKYGEISLTTRGKEVAKEISNRHEDLVSFLELLGVDNESAQLDACKIEHVVGQNTMQKLRKFLEFATGAPEEPIWLKHYRKFVETDERSECERQRN